ncbi:twin-arginine translocase TatA/TatE family subunit [Dactylosporangium roseum]|uniref:Twin-arginine translocase TatA/TatE family subunit n=1 Tax=Dactylosporangium roseum TaxID=47989 RepID=A0ABY5ZEJ8_9ACTN|nr:twin-arginine translocase TatA/TatE family subunit [Dactylosporangium roseum]UWZ40099.1 twin-arginine translocase TatA/TatE family subunit [Dactylosporangium roseum]
MGLENLDGWHLIALIVAGLLIFGPDRLPRAVGDGLRMVRRARRTAEDATDHLRREFGIDVRPEDLRPGTPLRQRLLTAADEASLREPLRDLYDEVRGVAGAVERGAQAAVGAAGRGSSPGRRATSAPPRPAGRTSWDDAT